MHIIKKIIIFHIFLGISFPAFSCSMMNVEPTTKDTVNKYNRAVSVLSAKVTKIFRKDINVLLKNKVRNYEGPIKVEMIVIESYKGKFKKSKLITFSSQYRDWNGCGGGDFNKNNLYYLKANELVVLYYDYDSQSIFDWTQSVFDWTRFENVTRQHKKMLKIKSGLYIDEIYENQK